MRMLRSLFVACLAVPLLATFAGADPLELAERWATNPQAEAGQRRRRHLT